MKKLLSVCLAIVMTLGAAVSTTAASISELEARQAELESQQAAYQAQLDEKNSAVSEKQSEVDAIVGKVQSVNEEISLIHEKISLLDTQISTKQGEIDTKNAEIETNMDVLRQRIKTIYMSGGDVSSLEIVLGAKDFGDFLDKVQVVQYVSNHDEELIDGIKSQLSTISAEKDALQSDKDQQVTEQTNLQTKQTELNTLLDENKETLANLQLSADQAQMNLTMSEEELSSLSEQIQEHYRQQNAARQQAAAASSDSGDDEISYSDSGSNTDYNDYSAPQSVESDGNWVWPTPGCYYLTSTFNEARSYETHNAVDIGAGMGTPVYAANSGTVVSSCSECTHNWGKSEGNWCNCGGGYGNYVWILHDNGYETIYGHFSSLTVSQGERVSAGQLIGYVGSTGWSTGAHLHFELRINGVKSNPMNLY